MEGCVELGETSNARCVDCDSVSASKIDMKTRYSRTDENSMYHAVGYGMRSVDCSRSDCSVLTKVEA